MYGSSFPMLLTAAVLATVLPAAAQDVGRGEAPPTMADSARLHRTARSEQADFERLRRRRLPETWPRGGSRCDERIGRFCLTHGDDDDEWIAPPDHPEVVSARLLLIDRLGDAAGAIPGDGWVAGQRVRYLVEARRFDEAISAAAECRAEPGWCAALAGYAFHYAARPAEADSTFTVALERMNEEERARWNDLRLVLEGASAREYRRLEDAERAAFEKRFWRLADPLLTRPGNELRSEHLARQVIDAFQDRAQSPDGLHWGSDLREILIRYGWPAGWERTRTTGFPHSEASFISHYSEAPLHLLPPESTLLGDTTSAREWDVERPRARTGYTVPLADSVARWFFPLAHQVATFRRGLDAVLVAAYELPADSMPEDADTRAGLALLPILDPLQEPTSALLEVVGRRGVLTARTRAQPLLVSLEVLVPAERRIARARHEVHLTALESTGMAISDLLLIDAAEPLPDSLDAAIGRSRSSERVVAGEAIGIYWEIYGWTAEAAPSVTMSLRLLEERPGWLRRLAMRAGLLREVVPIRLRWTEALVEGGYTPRSVALQVPEVAPGRYVLELAVETEGSPPRVAQRQVEVVAGPTP